MSPILALSPIRASLLRAFHHAPAGQLPDLAESDKTVITDPKMLAGEEIDRPPPLLRVNTKLVASASAATPNSVRKIAPTLNELCTSALLPRV